MIHLNKKPLLFLTSLLVAIFSSCYSKVEIISGNYISKEVNFRDGAKINLKISNIASFETKSSSSVPEAHISDIKSLTAFLTINPTDPFATGSNPMGDGVTVSVNYDTNNQISFSNVPVGGPYYAVISAFDDIVGSTTKNNITDPNPSIISTDNKWFVSNNSVNVLPSKNLIFSDSNFSLIVNLVLRKPIADSISALIIVNDGNISSLQKTIIN